MVNKNSTVCVDLLFKISSGFYFCCDFSFCFEILLVMLWNFHENQENHIFSYVVFDKLNHMEFDK